MLFQNSHRDLQMKNANFWRSKGTHSFTFNKTLIKNLQKATIAILTIFSIVRIV